VALPRIDRDAPPLLVGLRSNAVDFPFHERIETTCERLFEGFGRCCKHGRQGPKEADRSRGSGLVFVALEQGPRSGHDRAREQDRTAHFAFRFARELGERQQHHASEAPLTKRAGERSGQEGSLRLAELLEERCNVRERLRLGSAADLLQRLVDSAKGDRRSFENWPVRELPELRWTDTHGPAWRLRDEPADRIAPLLGKHSAEKPDEEGFLLQPRSRACHLRRNIGELTKERGTRHFRIHRGSPPGEPAARGANAARAMVLRVRFASLLGALLTACTHHTTPEVTDLDGHGVEPFTGPPHITVLAFTSTQCPISNRYAPELVRLYAEFAPRGVRFYLVYPLATESEAEVRAHVRAYGYRFAALRDPGHSLVARAGAHVTPEVAVFAPGGELAYRGRIDDRQVDFGKARPEPTTHDLERALEALVAGHPPEVPNTPAIGCSIPPVH
jgi:AhpC/TSA family